MIILSNVTPINLIKKKDIPFYLIEIYIFTFHFNGRILDVKFKFSIKTREFFFFKFEKVTHIELSSMHIFIMCT